MIAVSGLVFLPVTANGKDATSWPEKVNGTDSASVVPVSLDVAINQTFLLRRKIFLFIGNVSHVLVSEKQLPSPLTWRKLPNWRVHRYENNQSASLLNEQIRRRKRRLSSSDG